jgi:hypothetical protein
MKRFLLLRRSKRLRRLKSLMIMPKVFERPRRPSRPPEGYYTKARQMMFPSSIAKFSNRISKIWFKGKKILPKLSKDFKMMLALMLPNGPTNASVAQLPESHSMPEVRIIKINTVPSNFNNTRPTLILKN